MINIKEHGLTHRPDIDGLRAIAVTAVLIFHIFPSVAPWFAGGFTGVDIFFVISGYLITSILLKDFNRKTFSIPNFYSRRIRRIFPALIAVLLTVLVAGHLFLYPYEFHELTRHVVASAAFGENFLLRYQSGYFDTASESKPLLHLWSLAIEGQFYIIWPLLLSVFQRKTSLLFPVILGLAIISFSWNLYLSSHDVAAAYYSPAGRSWELMIGGILAYMSLSRPMMLSALPNVSANAGLAAIAAGLLLIDEHRYFPGWWALMPTFGAGLLIAAGPHAWVNRHILASRPFVWCGLISYPLYLWHWPVLVFALLINPSLGIGGRLAVFVTSVVFAALTYRLVEGAFRNRSKLHFMKLNISAWQAATMVSLAAASLTLHKLNVGTQLAPIQEIPGEWDFLTKQTGVSSPNMVGVYRLHPERPMQTLFVGDSHLAHYATRVSYVEDQNAKANAAVFAIGGACVPIEGVKLDDLRFRECWDARTSALAMINNTSVDTVVFGGSWSWYFNDKNVYFEVNGKRTPLTEPEGRKLAMDALEDQLKKAVQSGKRTFLVLDNPASDLLTLSQNTNRLFWHSLDFNQLIALDDATDLKLRSDLLRLARRAGARAIDPYDAVCEPNGCRWATTSGLPMYRDQSHFNTDWVREYGDFIDDTVQPL